MPYAGDDEDVRPFYDTSFWHEPHDYGYASSDIRSTDDKTKRAGFVGPTKGEGRRPVGFIWPKN